MNLARDRLRRRKRERYVGQWLPSPVAVAPEDVAPPSARYELLESLSLAFLLALETLTPNQRAVLVLRDVLDQTVLETAAALGLSVPNVKTTLHRARQRIATTSLEAHRQPSTPERQRRTREALEYRSAKVIIRGAARVALFNRRLLQIHGFPTTLEVRDLNGLPAMVLGFATTRPTQAPLNVIAASLDGEGRIAALFSVVADAKLTHVLG